MTTERDDDFDRRLRAIDRLLATAVVLDVVILILLLAGWPLGLHPACQVVAC